MFQRVLIHLINGSHARETKRKKKRNEDLTILAFNERSGGVKLRGISALLQLRACR